MKFFSPMVLLAIVQSTVLQEHDSEYFTKVPQCLLNGDIYSYWHVNTTGEMWLMEFYELKYHENIIEYLEGISLFDVRSLPFDIDNFVIKSKEDIRIPIYKQITYFIRSRIYCAYKYILFQGQDHLNTFISFVDIWKDVKLLTTDFRYYFTFIGCIKNVNVNYPETYNGIWLVKNGTYQLTIDNLEKILFLKSNRSYLFGNRILSERTGTFSKKQLTDIECIQTQESPGKFLFFNRVKKSEHLIILEQNQLNYIKKNDIIIFILCVAIFIACFIAIICINFSISSN